MMMRSPADVSGWCWRRRRWWWRDVVWCWCHLAFTNVGYSILWIKKKGPVSPVCIRPELRLVEDHQADEMALFLSSPPTRWLEVLPQGGRGRKRERPTVIVRNPMSVPKSDNTVASPRSTRSGVRGSMSLVKILE